MKDTRRIDIRYSVMLLCLVAFSVLVLSRHKVTASTLGTGTVTASSLNVRKSASASSDSIGKVQYGTQVTILSTKKDSDRKIWYKIRVLISEKQVEGYVHSDYIEKNTSYNFVNKTGIINATSLNIRESTSTTSTSLVRVPYGTRVTIIGTKTVFNTKWVNVTLTVNGKQITGFTHSVYVTKDVITAPSNQYDLGICNTNGAAVYNKANTYTKLMAKLGNKQEGIILGTINVAGTSWYKVKVKMNSTNVYGYVQASKITKVTSTVSATQSLTGTITQKVKAYQIASAVSKKIATLSNGKVLTVKGNLTVNGVKWYRCTLKVSGVSHTAYVLASCVQLDAEVEFEQSISSFPESYKTLIRKLHVEYPNWSFVPIHTGLDWSTVIENESKAGRNTIQSNVPKGGSVTAYSAPFSYLSTGSGAYNWATDTYILMDGSNWYTASKDVIEYYMDPRNSITADRIWQFEALAYDEKQSLAVVSKILAGTFMSGDYSCFDSTTNKTEKGNYAETFMQVGKLSGASPYFLAVRAKQELGINGSGSVSGKYPGFEGIYNFYNIGANDSSTGGAIANGLRWASTGTTYMRPWTSIYKAMLGGAQYISTSYINKGQNTLYTQKFNVVYAPYYSHQYMTNVMAPTSESKSQYNSYNSLGILKEEYVFYIPVYQNMPSTPEALPASKGNPNSYVKSLTATYGNKKLALTPTFSYLTNSYTLVVENDINSITISGEPISRYGSISGLGTYDLQEGKTTTITIKCTAGNGTSTNYTLKVSRLAY